MPTVPISTLLQIGIQYVPGLVGFAAAALVCFKLSQQARSHGLFLISLGLFIKLVVDIALDTFYLFVELPAFFNSPGSGFNQLIGWTSFAISLGALTAMLSLVVYGGWTITKERSSMVQAAL